MREKSCAGLQKFVDKKKNRVFLFFIVIVVSSIYGTLFLHQYPNITLTRSELYGNDYSNLKDFSVEKDGRLFSLSSDPWISYSLTEAVPIAIIDINASDVDDKGGYVHIFDTDTWSDKSGKLLNGFNLYYFYSKYDTWITKNFRFDFLEVEGASCLVNKIIINPPFYVFGIGFVRTLIPVLLFLVIFDIIFKFILYISEIKKVGKDLAGFSLYLMLSVIGGWYILKNLRIAINSTNILLCAICIFAIFLLPIPGCKDPRKKYLLLFSVLLAVANNLGSHIVIDQTPYSDLMDKSYLSPHGLNDVVGVVVVTIIFYRIGRNVLYRVPDGVNLFLSKKIFVTRTIKFYFPMTALLIGWLPYLVLYYPGFILGDSVSSIEQALGNWGLGNHHPVIYTIFIRICIRIGLMYGNLALGVAIYSILQMLFVSFALAKSIEWLSRHKCPCIVSCIITGCFVLMPFFGETSIAMWKDPLFGASTVLWTLSLLDYMESSPEKEKHQNLLAVFITSLLVCFTRNNGIYSLIFSLLVIAVECIRHYTNFKKQYYKLFITGTIVTMIYFLIIGPAYTKLKIIPTEKAESVGICLNQMARVAASPDGVMTEEDLKFMNNLLPLEKYRETYRPCVVDLLKWDQEFDQSFLNSHFSDFLKTYISLGIRNPGKYISGWALMTFGYWAPNRWELDDDNGNLSRGNFNDLISSDLEIRQVTLNDLPDSFFYKIFPINGTIIEMSIVNWIAVAAFLLALISHDRAGTLGLALSIGIIITLIIASPYWYWQRYGMAQFYLLPIYIYFLIKDMRKLKKEVRYE